MLGSLPTGLLGTVLGEPVSGEVLPCCWDTGPGLEHVEAVRPGAVFTSHSTTLPPPRSLGGRRQPESWPSTGCDQILASGCANGLHEASSPKLARDGLPFEGPELLHVLILICLVYYCKEPVTLTGMPVNPGSLPRHSSGVLPLAWGAGEEGRHCFASSEWPCL